MKKVLFISKKRTLCYTEEKTEVRDKIFSSGLSNSINFSIILLEELGYKAMFSNVIDSNFIDRELYYIRPSVCIIEAIWVPPYKMEELKNKYPKIKFICRIHSQITFLANEGIALSWLYKYNSMGVEIACNHRNTQKDLSKVGIDSFLLPNYYNIKDSLVNEEKNNEYINISCFGAIRPMKNHLIQAISAIHFANIIGKKLKFFINVNREEQGGNSVLKNLRSLFQNSKHELIEVPWLCHEDFIKIVSSIDIGMQVSLSETFNIVTADMVNNNIPVVVSKEIYWLPFYVKSNPTNVRSIILKLLIIYFIGNTKLSKIINKLCLKFYNYKSKKKWEMFMLYI